MQIAGSRIEQQQRLGQHRHARCRLGQLAKRRDHFYRLAHQRCFGVGRIAPQTDVLFVYVEAGAAVIDLAEATFRWQAQGADPEGFGQRTTIAGNQPLLADALLAHQEHKVVARAVTEQAQPFDGKAGFRQVARAAPAVTLPAHQQGLLFFLVQGGDQRAAVIAAVVEGFETPRQLAEQLAVATEHLQAFGSDLQPLRRCVRWHRRQPLAVLGSE
ncbi:hypothetical protein D3C73_966650 [compost metagenome]